MRNCRQLAGFALAASLAAGCSGQSGLTPPQLPAPQANATQGITHPAKLKGKARVEIRIPRRHRHRAHYVSPNTASMQISANGKSLGTYNLTPASKGCTTVGGDTQCAFTIGVPAGRVTFGVSLFDAHANLLSQGSVTTKIVPGTLAVIPLVLDGVIHAIAVTVGDADANAGTSATLPVYVTAYDASGAAIIGPGSYNTPITLSDGDASGITTLSATTVRAPGAKIGLAYNGKSIVSASIGASATGVAPANVTPGTFAPTPTVVASYSVPNTLAAGSAPYAITPGPDGNIWYTVVANNNGTAVGTNAIVQMSTGGQVLNTYVAGTTAGLTGPKAYFSGIVTGPDGNLWFTDGQNKKVGKITTAGVVTEFSAGTMTPYRIVVGPDGALWFTTNSSQIGRVDTSGNVTSTSITGAHRLTGIVLGKDGNLYAADAGTFSGGHQIWQFVVGGGAVSASSAVAVPDSSDGPNSQLLGITQTADGELWFTNSSCSPSTIGSVVIASPFSTSSVHDFTTKQGCGYPSFVTPTPDGSRLFVAIWDYPVIEQEVPTTPGAAPVQTDFAFQAPTENETFQETFDITIGPDGNVWSTIYTNSSSAQYDYGNIVKLVY